MLIIFLGPPGSGKGTQSNRLFKLLRVPHLSTGDALRQAVRGDTELGRAAAGFLQRGQLVPDSLVVDIVSERLSQPDCRAGCLLDGFPRSILQVQALDEFLKQKGRQLDLVLQLLVPNQELQRRLLERSAIEKRSDDTPEMIARRLVVYRDTTEPLVSHYRRQEKLEAIDGTGSPDEVFERIETVVAKYRHA